ncbi:ADP-ribosylglycohydrolase family protein [Nocardioides sp. zg-536]|uniref:ADP-ribosylglycohydrolase family protein n=1 Tax=Nocardioides faecalis TaxID=2803858 RepID=A0A938Y6L0_9ACTN|nr:ADP-ribosylglycohydrolase family protein [Nocardioides faecalis]MBM9460205.1 ADP-ribosylglycohydrolase family protein [Nocardioides faecalis]QVI60003.1 ADP-ribosylglycohydrolase family protein [Nocardioides faecalis]
MTRLTAAQMDRACGTLLASAAGDALGAGYEFGSARLGPEGPAMIGGGLGDFAPGEWTDDTTMAWCVADVAATGADLRTEAALDEVARRFREWYETGPADIGNQTASVLRAVGPLPTAARMTAASAALHERTGHTAGNGSLMRTAPVALAHLDDPDAVAEAAWRISALTHHDPLAGQACVLWSLAIRHAVLHAEIDVRVGLAYLEPEAASYWAERIAEAEESEPGRFNPNGYVVTAFQAAWSAIHHTRVPAGSDGCDHLVQALRTAIAIGNDTDTVAAIAGGLLGARWGASAVPAQWRRVLHGYPGLRGEQLVHLAHLAANRGPGLYDWPTVASIDYAHYGIPRTLVPHPYDDGVWLGDAGVLADLPADIDAVVSLCLVGTAQVPEHVEHVTYRLIDVTNAGDNPNLDFVLLDAARTVQALRAEGRTVLVHCVAAQSRTPTVGAAYAVLQGAPVGEALRRVCDALPAAYPNHAFRDALERLGRHPEVQLRRDR